jgi:hypothetical protein
MNEPQGDWRGGRTASRRVAVRKAGKGTNAETWLKHEADDMLLAMPGSLRIRQPHECGITACVCVLSNHVHGWKSR